jgi:hypothetical protein
MLYTTPLSHVTGRGVSDHVRDLQKDARPPRRPPPAVGRADAPTRAVPWEKDPVAIGAPARCAWPLPPTRLSVQPHSNENCTGLAQIAGLGPTLWLEIPVRALKLAHNLGQPCTIFVAARGPCHRISCPCRLTRAEQVSSFRGVAEHRQPPPESRQPGNPAEPLRRHFARQSEVAITAGAVQVGWSICSAVA